MELQEVKHIAGTRYGIRGVNESGTTEDQSGGSVIIYSGKLDSNDVTILIYNDDWAHIYFEETEVDIFNDYLE
jgi:hypothetical protein